MIRRELPRTICAGWSVEPPHNAAEDSPSRGAPRPQPVPPPLPFTFPKIFRLCRLAQCFSLFRFHFHTNGPDESQEFASYCGDHPSCVFTARGELSIAATESQFLVQFTNRFTSIRDHSNRSDLSPSRSATATAIVSAWTSKPTNFILFTDRLLSLVALRFGLTDSQRDPRAANRSRSFHVDNQDFESTPIRPLASSCSSAQDH